MAVPAPTPTPDVELDWSGTFHSVVVVIGSLACLLTAFSFLMMMGSRRGR